MPKQPPEGKDGFMPDFAQIARSVGLPADALSSENVTIPTKLFRFLLSLQLREMPFFEEAYRSAHPDVDAAVRGGAVASAHDHYVGTGYFEGRSPGRHFVDEEWYRSHYADLKAAHRIGELKDLATHFNRTGRAEGRVGSTKQLADSAAWRAVLSAGARGSPSFPPERSSSVEAATGPQVVTGPRGRMLLLGGCQVASLGKELRGGFEHVQLWRAPTIALMSAPIRPAGPLGFDDRHARYILDDCAKAHLPLLQAAECELFVFEIMRDVRCPLVRCGDTFLYDPNQMYFRVADAPPPSERAVDLGAFLGTAEVEPFTAFDPAFFDVWCAHFDRFYEDALAPRLAQGCVVVLQDLFMAKQTVPPSDAMHGFWDYCDAINALLRRMHAHAGSYDGIQRVGFAEAQYVSSDGAPYGGPYITHPIKELYELMAEQVRAIVSSRGVGTPVDAARVGIAMVD